MSLLNLKLNEKAKIKSLIGNDKLAKRLSTLGFTEGTEIKVKKFAPLGDPIMVRIRGYNIAIRKNDAKNIIINK